MSERLTVESIKAMRASSWTREAVASCLTGRARVLAQAGKDLYHETGLVCAEVEDRELWRLDQRDDGGAYNSWTDWVADIFGDQRSSAQEAARIVRMTKDDISEEDFKQMQRCKVRHLADCSPAAKRDPEVHKAAKDKTVSETAFVQQVNAKHNQHLEESTRWHLANTEDQKADILAACADYRVENDSPQAPIGECIWGICREYHEAQAKQAEAMDRPILDSVQ